MCIRDRNQPYLLDQHSMISTPSIGVTLFNGHSHSLDDLLKQADIAMYQAKTSGRNAIRFYDPFMQAAIATRTSLERDLRAALVAEIDARLGAANLSSALRVHVVRALKEGAAR